MRPDTLAAMHSISSVQPRAIKSLAASYGWKETTILGGRVAVYIHPEHEGRQLLVPLMTSLEDYSDLVRTAVARVAEFAEQPYSVVVNELLLPPADVLRFSHCGSDSENGTLPLAQAISILQGSQRMLSAQAHSQLNPKAFHPRLSRTDAEAFVRTCRLGQTEKGSFTLTIACPLAIPPGTLPKIEPYARSVTSGVAQSLAALVDATQNNQVDTLAERDLHPYLSANFFESLLLLRPSDDKAVVRFTVRWSNAIEPSVESSRISGLTLASECFEVAEHLAQVLRKTPEPQLDVYVGYVDVLRGEPDESGRLCGEVVFAILVDDSVGEVVRARADLSPEEYQIAGKAHLDQLPVVVHGYLVRSPRLNRLQELKYLRLVGEELSSPLESADEGG